MKNLIYGSLICCSLTAFSQKKMTKHQFIADSLKIIKPTFIRPQLKLDNRVTIFNFQRLSVTGIDAGVLIRERLRLTVGFYTISDKLTYIKKSINSVDYAGKYKLNYGAINVEFAYKKGKNYALGLPIELGMGSNSLYYKSSIDNTETPKQSGLLLLTYFGLSGTYKPIRWLGIKGAVGYRKTIINQIQNIPFDGFYYSVGLVVDFREVIIDYKLYKLKKRYHKNANSVETAVDLITH